MSGSAKTGIELDITDLLAKVRELETELPKNVTRRGLRAMAVIVRDRAKELVPVRTGALKKSIMADTKRTRDRKSYYGRVTIKSGTYNLVTKVSKGGKKSSRLVRDKKGKGPVDGRIRPRNYAAQVETGTAPHSVRPGSTKKKPIPSKIKQHPGSRPKPFMRPAFEQSREKALNEFIRLGKNELAKIAAKPRARKK